MTLMTNMLEARLNIDPRGLVRDCFLHWAQQEAIREEWVVDDGEFEMHVQPRLNDPLWSFAKSFFACGKTSGHDLCEVLGLDPDRKPRDLPPAYPCKESR